MERLTRFVLVLVWIFESAPLSLSETAKPPTPVAISAVAAVRHSPAFLNHPVKLRGVITAFSGWKNSFFLQDPSGGISVDRQEQAALQTGQTVEVTGTVQPGFFAPVILSNRIDVVPNQRPPNPLHPTYDALARGQLDSQWIEVSGVIHSAQLGSVADRKVLNLDLHMSGGQLTVRVLSYPSQNFNYLVDSVVTIQGVAGTIFNSRRQLVGLRMYTPRLDQVRILEPALEIAKIPASPLGSLLAFSPTPVLEHRAKVLGTVTYQNPGSLLYIQEDGAGVSIQTTQTGQFPIGTVVEAVGFVSAGGYSPVLREATVRALRPGTPPSPVPVSASRLITSENGFRFAPQDGMLVRLHAQIIDRPPPVPNQIWLMRDGPVVFEAYLVEPVDGHRLAIGPGNEVSVTGICVVESGQGRNPESFHLLVRSARDFAVVRTPFWDVSRLFLISALFVLTSLALLAWAFQTQMTRTGIGAQDLHSRALALAFARAATVVAALVWIIAVIDLLGWAFSIEMLKRVVPGYVAMMPNTGVAFLVASTSFLLDRVSIPRQSIPRRSLRWRLRLQTLCGSFVTAIGALTLLEYLTGMSLYIDGTLIGQFSDRSAQGDPLRMAFVSAVAFVLLGCAILIQRKPFVLAAQWFAIGTGVVCILNLVGYLYGLQNGEVNSYSFMAVHTALSFLLLSLAVLFRSADSGIMAVITSDALGGVMGRRLIPAALLLPAAIGWIRWQGELSGLYDAAFGLAIFVSANMAAFGLLIWTSAILLNRLDAARFQTQRELRLLVDGTRDYAIFMLDRDGNIATWNHGAERIKGYTASEVIGRHFSYLYENPAAPAQQTNPKAQDALRIAAAEGRFEEEDWQVRRDDSRFWAHVVITALRDKTGELRGFSNITRDATELKKATEDLVSACRRAEDANRAKSDFLATMSHEIRTPMNAILGMTDLVMETGLNAIQRDYVERCRRAGANLLSLINDILDLSKIESSRFELEQIPFNLPDLIERTTELIAPKAEAKGIVLSIQITPNTPDALVGDPFRLQQLLINLLGNAVKFTQHGEISLVAGPHPAGEPGHLLFTITDTGIGIPADKLGVIFEDFTQAESSTTRRFGGSGLGLGIARRLAHRMGGELTASSVFGQGSCFRFDATFLVSQEALPLAAPAPAHQLVGRRVLVVDGNSTNRLITSNMCFSWGMIPVESTSTGAAYLLLRDESQEHRLFSLAIMHAIMPGMDGFDSFLKIRSLCPEMPIIMTASDSKPGAATRAKALGAAAYAVNPMRSAHLLKLISAAIKPLPADESASASAASDLAISKILVAEDSDDNRFLLEAYLADQPYEVTFVGNGEEAVFMFKKDTFGLVLMDVQMPVMDGLRATESIRAFERQMGLSPTPILALTANAFLSDRELSRAAGCDGHLSKPISRETLVSAVKASILQVHSVEHARQHS